MHLKTLLILSVLLLVFDAELAHRRIGPDLSYLRDAADRRRAQEEDALKAVHLLGRVNSGYAGIAMRHAELRDEYKKKAEYTKAGAKEEDERDSRIKDIRGTLSLESEAFKKSLDSLGEFHYGRVPDMPRRLLESLPLMSGRERGASSEEHLRKGIASFQSEDLEGAIRMWDAALELDPGNRTAAEYKSRAEVILKRLNEIRAKDGPSAAPVKSAPPPS